jgi:hypothetical protein
VPNGINNATKGAGRWKRPALAFVHTIRIVQP